MLTLLLVLLDLLASSFTQGQPQQIISHSFFPLGGMDDYIRPCSNFTCVGQQLHNLQIRQFVPVLQWLKFNLDNKTYHNDITTKNVDLYLYYFKIQFPMAAISLWWIITSSNIEAKQSGIFTRVLANRVTFALYLENQLRSLYIECV